VFTNNLMRHNAYGMFGTGQAYGNGSIAYYAPGALVQRNVMASDASPASRYPADNAFPSIAAFTSTFRNAAAFDFRLAPASPYVRAGLDGKDLGCDFGALPPAAPPAAPTLLRIRPN
jgi:hypothetical protein